jgi:AICAR transformylase/IMP cyclohydrolase PurH
MKRLALCTLILALAAQTAVAQQPAKPKVNPDAHSQTSDRLGDDDGGTVQTVPVDTAAAKQSEAHAAPLMKSVRQVSVFLGTAWAERAARGRERILGDLADRLGELQNNKVNILPSAPSVEDFTDLTKSAVNDLTIQQKLTQMLNSKAIPAPQAETVYVVFLGPGIQSSVGGHKGGIDYAAYHNLIRTDAGEVAYVVVPFNDSAERQATAAAQAVIQTAFNPKD